MIMEMFEKMTDTSQKKVYYYARFLYLKDNDMLEVGKSARKSSENRSDVVDFVIRK